MPPPAPLSTLEWLACGTGPRGVQRVEARTWTHDKRKKEEAAEDMPAAPSLAFQTITVAGVGDIRVGMKSIEAFNALNRDFHEFDRACECQFCSTFRMQAFYKKHRDETGHEFGTGRRCCLGKVYDRLVIYDWGRRNATQETVPYDSYLYGSRESRESSVRGRQRSRSRSSSNDRRQSRHQRRQRRQRGSWGSGTSYNIDTDEDSFAQGFSSSASRDASVDSRSVHFGPLPSILRGSPRHREASIRGRSGNGVNSFALNISDTPEGLRRAADAMRRRADALSPERGRVLGEVQNNSGSENGDSAPGSSGAVGVVNFNVNCRDSERHFASGGNLGNNNQNYPQNPTPVVSSGPPPPQNPSMQHLIQRNQVAQVLPQQRFCNCNYTYQVAPVGPLDPYSINRCMNCGYQTQSYSNASPNRNQNRFLADPNQLFLVELHENQGVSFYHQNSSPVFHGDGFNPQAISPPLISSQYLSWNNNVGVGVNNYSAPNPNRQAPNWVNTKPVTLYHPSTGTYWVAEMANSGHARPRHLVPHIIQVLMVEHVEYMMATDPAPNAFYDARSGTLRVYNSHVWSNRGQDKFFNVPSKTPLLVPSVGPIFQINGQPINYQAAYVEQALMPTGQFFFPADMSDLINGVRRINFGTVQQQLSQQGPPMGCPPCPPAQMYIVNNGQQGQVPYTPVANGSNQGSYGGGNGSNGRSEPSAPSQQQSIGPKKDEGNGNQAIQDKSKPQQNKNDSGAPAQASNGDNKKTSQQQTVKAQEQSNKEQGGSNNSGPQQSNNSAPPNRNQNQNQGNWSGNNNSGGGWSSSNDNNGNNGGWTSSNNNSGGNNGGWSNNNNAGNSGGGWSSDNKVNNSSGWTSSNNNSGEWSTDNNAGNSSGWTSSNNDGWGSSGNNNNSSNNDGWGSGNSGGGGQSSGWTTSGNNQSSGWTSSNNNTQGWGDKSAAQSTGGQGGW